MRIVTRLIALTRSIQLNRQFRDVERMIAELPLSSRRQLAALAMKEFANAAKCEFPHLYGTPPEQTSLEPWGKGTEVGFNRAKSSNPVVKLHGIALWLTVAYHETRDSKSNDLQNLHRQLMRTLRLLKESVPAAQENLWGLTSQTGQAVA
jgi:hypothetical protein